MLDLLRQELPDTSLVVAELGIGTEDDAERAAYLRVRARGRPRPHRPGIDVRGFFRWSSVDTDEWIHGFDARFGIIDRDPT